MSKDDGGSAFPRTGTESPVYEKILSQEGMSLRDYFAAQSVSGRATAKMSIRDMENVAGRAYELADAMLKERAK